AEYRFAVDSASLPLLNAFAALAFCAEITRLPSQMSAVTSAFPAEPSNELVTAQTMPLPSTRVSHIGKPRPPLGFPAGGTTVRNAVFRLASVKPAAASWLQVSA